MKCIHYINQDLGVQLPIFGKSPMIQLVCCLVTTTYRMPWLKSQTKNDVHPEIRLVYPFLQPEASFQLENTFSLKPHFPPKMN